MKSKTILILVFISVVFFFLTSCGGSGGDSGVDADDFYEEDDSGSAGDPLDPPIEIVAKTITPATSRDDYFTDVNYGETILLEDGIYTQGLGGFPDDIKMRAINPGQVKFRGGDDAWGSIVELDGNGVELNGLNIGNPDNPNSNALTISGTNNILRNTASFNGGAHKHKVPIFVTGTGHLIEDSWAWGEGRYTIQAFQASFCTFRRVLARWDETVGGEPGEPNAAFCCYNSNDMLYENIISLDYGTPETPMNHGGDIFQANNVNVSGPNSNNRFFGVFIVNHAINTNNRHAFRSDGTQNGGQPEGNPGNIVDDIYIRENGNSIAIDGPFSTIDIRKGTIINANAPSNSYVPTGPAQTQKRYQDGVLTNVDLWPWPNEARIRADLSGPDNKRSTNPADNTWQSSNNLGYSAWIAGSKSLEDYILNK